MNRARLVRLTSSVLLFLAGCGKERPSPAAGTAAQPSAPAEAVGSSDPRAALFLEKGCPQCHTISALGIKSPAEIGPDLTFAYTDVQSRFNMKLEEFLHNPTGTMQVVLSSQISLSPEERDSVIHILKGIHEEAEKAEKHD
jgi:mono/diheme cytochrome c family protein